MMVGVKTVGANAELVRDLLEVVARENERFYRRTRTPSIMDRGVKYRPDPKAREIVIVAADSIQRLASCGSAAAAMVGYFRAHDNPADIEIYEIERAVWHAKVRVHRRGFLPATVWDPAFMLQRWRP